jgi:hypothetical protein
MKARIRKTGEIVDIISYSGGTVRNNILDKVSYIDSKGVEHDGETLNFYWDFETTDENTSSMIDWNQARLQIALEMAKFACKESKSINLKDLAARCVMFADTLIEELKKNQND